MAPVESPGPLKSGAELQREADARMKILQEHSIRSFTQRKESERVRHLRTAIRAAIIIQRAFRKYLLRRSSLAPSRRRRSTKVTIAGQHDGRGTSPVKPASQVAERRTQQLSSSRSHQRSEQPSPTSPTSPRRTKARSATSEGAIFDKKEETRRQIAALTIQLAWRRYKANMEEKAARAARKANGISTRMRSGVPDHLTRSQKQRVRMVYAQEPELTPKGDPALLEYKPKPPKPVRTLSVPVVPSAAVVSYNNALSEYRRANTESLKIRETKRQAVRAASAIEPR